jgi:hypothetical protein
MCTLPTYIDCEFPNDSKISLQRRFQRRISVSTSSAKTLACLIIMLLFPVSIAFAQTSGGGASTGLMENPPHLAPLERAATHPAFESGGLAPVRPMAVLATGSEPRTDTQSNDLSLEGTISYNVSASTLELTADRVANNRSGGTSGTLRLSLWASASQPSFGSTINGYRMGYYQFTTTLAAGYYLGSVDRFVNFTAPPNGTYWVTMCVDEYSSSNNQAVNDGFGYHDLRVFSNQITLGAPTSSAVIIDHAMTSSVDPSTFLANDRLSSFQATTASALSWIKLNPFIGAHTFQWKFYAPDGSLYSDSGVLTNTGTTGYAYYAYYYGIYVAGTAAASKPGLWHVNFFLDGSAAVNETFTIVGSTTCTPSATTLCLLNNRFQVTLSVNDPRVSGTGSANATVQGDWGYFDVPAATGTSDKPVIFVKVIDGRAVNQKYWVFYGGLTDIQYTFIVTDKQTGATKTYSKATGTYDGRADTSAFAGP